MSFALSVLSGAAYGLPYRISAWGPLAWLSIVPLLWVCRRARPAQAFAYGWLFGAAAFAVSSSALVETIAQFLLMPRAAAIAIFAAYCLALGLQFALCAGLARLAAEGLHRRRGWTVPGALALALPPIWVAMEWIYPEQFPKNMAMTQIYHLPLVQSVELFGPAATAWLLCAFNAALYAAARVRGKWRPLAAVLVLAGVNEAFGIARMRQVDAEVAKRIAEGGAVRVGILQGSEPFRGRPKRHTFVSDRELYASLTRQAVARGALDLIVWPEATFEGTVRCDGGPEGLVNPRLDGKPLQAALQAVLPQPAHILLSVLAEAPGAAGARTFNVSILTGPSREFMGAALKRYLIPFGEYLPGADLFPILRRLSPNSWALTSGRGRNILRMRDGTRLGILICYEDLLPAYVRAVCRAGADLLVYQASDAWFRGSLPAFHLRAGSLRAVENRKFMIRALESGVSAVVDPVGRVSTSLEFGARGGIAAQAARLGGATLSTRLGDALYALAAALSLLLLAPPLRRPAR